MLLKDENKSSHILIQIIKDVSASLIDGDVNTLVGFLDDLSDIPCNSYESWVVDVFMIKDNCIAFDIRDSDSSILYYQSDVMFPDLETLDRVFKQLDDGRQHQFSIDEELIDFANLYKDLLGV